MEISTKKTKLPAFQGKKKTYKIKYV